MLISEILRIKASTSLFTTTPDGAVLDEITLESAHRGSVFEATTERRLRTDAKIVGEGIGSYLKSRLK